MPFPIAQSVIDNIDDGTVVDFFGGEALLEIELLNQIVDYANTNKRHIVFQLFSNGTRYDDEVKTLLAKGVNIGVSFDGYSNFTRTHNHALTAKIFENIKKMKRDIPHLGVKSSITPENMTELRENAKYMVENGFNFVSHFILREQGFWTPETIPILRTNIRHLLEWYIFNIEDVKLDYFDGMLVGNKRDTGCWAGREGVAVDCNGELYPCQRFLTNGSNFKIGTVESGITNNMFKRYNIANFVGCKKCTAFERCTNVCIAAQHEAGMMFCPIKEVCEVTKIVYEEVKVLEPYRPFIEDRLMKIHKKRSEI